MSIPNAHKGPIRVDIEDAEGSSSIICLDFNEKKRDIYVLFIEKTEKPGMFFLPGGMIDSYRLKDGDTLSKRIIEKPSEAALREMREEAKLCFLRYELFRAVKVKKTIALEKFPHHFFITLLNDREFMSLPSNGTGDDVIGHSWIRAVDAVRGDEKLNRHHRRDLTKALSRMFERLARVRNYPKKCFFFEQLIATQEDRNFNAALGELFEVVKKYDPIYQATIK